MWPLPNYAQERCAKNSKLMTALSVGYFEDQNISHVGLIGYVSIIKYIKKKYIDLLTIKLSISI